MFLYVADKTDSTSYFQEFYAKDMALLSDVVVASPGTLVVTYDNIKTSVPMNFSFRKGLVKTFRYDERFGYQEPYGLYDGLTTDEHLFQSPSFLTFAKHGDRFSVQVASAYLSDCSLGARRLGEVKPTLLKVGGTPADLRSGAHETLALGFPRPPSLKEDDANIVFTVSTTKSTRDRITIQYDDSFLPEDAQYLACVLENQFDAFTDGFEVKSEKGLPPVQDKVGINLILEYSSEDVLLPDRVIGQVIGRGVIIYARQ